MPEDLFAQIREIHEALRPVATWNPNTGLTWRSRTVRPAVIVTAALISTVVALLIVVRSPVPPLMLLALVGGTVVLIGVDLALFILATRRELRNNEADLFTGILTRSGREAVTAARLMRFDRRALADVLAEYDGGFEAVEHYRALLFGPARMGGVIGLVTLLIGTPLGADKAAGLWVVLAVVAGLAIGGFFALGAFEGQRRTRALLARMVALKAT